MSDEYQRVAVKTITDGEVVAAIDQTINGSTNGVALTLSIPSGSNTIGRVSIRNGADTADVDVLNSTPAGTEYGMVTRNIPYGTQAVSGTVASNQGTAAPVSGAWPILVTNGSNTADVRSSAPGAFDNGVVVRNIPSGTQQIAGSVSVTGFDQYANPKYYFATTGSNLAAGATHTFNATAVTGGKTGYLTGVYVSSTLPALADVYRVSASVATRVRKMVSSASVGDVSWEPPKEFITATDRFRVDVKNNDNSKAAEFYVTVLWDELP